MSVLPDATPDSGDPLPIAGYSRAFICPECGSLETSERLRVLPPATLNQEDPWTKVHEITICAHCGRGIPAHLGFRWRMTLEQAQAQWRARFRQWPA